MTRISGGSSPQLNTTFASPQMAGRADAGKPIGEQIQKVLFGRQKPPVLDPAQHPVLAHMLMELKKLKKKIAVMAGDKEDDYDIVLADSTIAMIDEGGTIYLGKRFLESQYDSPEVIVGALAHEIGHQPKRWRAYQDAQTLSQEEIDLLCRHEETRADIFAGKALAEMGLSCEPLIAFLQAIEDGPHPQYFDAKTRGQVIREAHAGRSYRQKARRALFPELDRMTSPKGHLGDF